MEERHPKETRRSRIGDGWQKLFCSVTILAIFFSATITLSVHAHLFKPPEPQTDADWTIMIYTAADNDDLDRLPYFYRLLNELESVGSTNNIKVLLLYDGIGKNPAGDENTHIYYVQKGLRSSLEIPLHCVNTTWRTEVNTGSPRTLVDFAKYCMQHYRAKHYALVINSLAGLTILCNDFSGKADELTTVELRAALSEIKASNKNSNLDILIMTTSYTGMLEWAYQLQPYVDFLVCSESVCSIHTTVRYWRIPEWVSFLILNPDSPARALADYIVRNYMDTTRTDWDPTFSATAAAIDLSRLDMLIQATDRLASELKKGLGDYRSEISTAINLTDAMDNYIRADLYHLATKLLAVNSTYVREAANEVIAAINTTVMISLSHTGGAGSIKVDNAHGLSVFLPKTEEMYREIVGLYKNRLIFGKTTNWTEFLNEYFHVIPPQPPAPSKKYVFFQTVTMVLKDTDRSGKNETAIVSYAVNTVLDYAVDVAVIIDVADSRGNFVRTFHDNYTVIRNHTVFRTQTFIGYSETYKEYAHYNFFIYLYDSYFNPQDYAEFLRVRIEVPTKTNYPPVARLTLSRYSLGLDEKLILNGSGSTDRDGAVVEYYFDFGDGTSSGWIEKSVVSHTYLEPGTYVCRLRVKDNRGTMSSWSTALSVTVKAAGAKKVSFPVVIALLLLLVLLLVVTLIYEKRPFRRRKRR